VSRAKAYSRKTKLLVGTGFRHAAVNRLLLHCQHYLVFVCLSLIISRLPGHSTIHGGNLFSPAIIRPMYRFQRGLHIM